MPRPTASFATGTFSLPSFDGSDLDPRVVDLGLLLGLLTSPSETPTDATTSVNTGWFDGIPGQLAQIPQRATPLIDLLQRLLGGLQSATPQPGEPDGTSVTPPRIWFNIPHDGNPTPLAIVLPATAAASNNLLSLGFSTSYTKDGITIYAYGVVPVFSVPNTAEASFVLGQSGAPIELHLTVSGGTSTSVNGFELSTYFTFSAAPTFSLQFLAGATASGAAYTSVAQLTANNGLTLLNQILAFGACQSFLKRAIGPTTATPGSLLGPTPGGLGFLTQSTGGVWSVGTLNPFTGKTATQIASEVFEVLLSALASSSAPIIPIGTPPHGQPATGVYVQAESDGHGGTDYGFRLALPPLALPIGSPGTDPTITLQLGSWLSGEAITPTDTTWWARAATGTTVPAEPAPGITVFLLNAASGGTLSFTGRLELASVGLDCEPPANKSLVSKGGFSLGGLEARGYLQLDLTQQPTVVGYGGALLVQQIGYPLGQSFANAGGVASTVLSAGGSGDPQPKQKVNPAFSLSAAFVSGSTTPVAIQLYDATGAPKTPVWLPIQRSFGPVNLQKLGVSWRNAVTGGADAQLTLDLDGGVTLGPLAIELDDLSIAIPPAHPLDTSQYSLDLAGLNISFSSGAVSLDAGLLHQDSEYVGEAAIKAGRFNIGAIGAFGTTGGSPSLFVFGWTNETLGGPACFFVTGLAAGFGYNRGLTLPSVDQVQSFPLLAAFSGGPSPFGTGDLKSQAASALTTLVNGNYVPETRGAYWLAAGVQFKTFQLVHSSALLAIEFGPDLTIALLGLSTFQLGSAEHPYVNVQLQLDASLKPDDGVMMVLGELTSNSYVLDPACHLTGGFAFGFWFGDNPHAGDFVVTVGGYHPAFTPPSYYPAVPRLAVHWAVSSDVTILGDAYFAITPGCVMAGGGLQAVYQSGNLRAWLAVEADFLVQWRPFRFSAGMSISIGVSYTIHLLFIHATLSVQLGATLELWGPPTGGSVGIDWYVISFSIPFGSNSADSATIAWSDFVTNLLPNQPVPPSTPPSHGPSALVATTAPAPTVQPRIEMPVTGGQIRQTADGGWIVRADGLAFNVASSVPANSLTFSAGTSTGPAVGTYAIGIVPLGLPSISSTLTVTLAPTAGGTGQINGTFTAVLATPNLPAAVWGGAAAASPSSAMLALPVGFDVSADAYAATGIAPIPLTTLEYDIIDPQTGGSGNDPAPAPLPLSSTATAAAASGAESAGSLAIIQSTLTGDATVTGLRTAVLSAAADFGYGPGPTGAPTGLAGNIPLYLRAPTLLGTPAGVTWPTS